MQNVLLRMDGASVPQICQPPFRRRRLVRRPPTVGLPDGDAGEAVDEPVAGQREPGVVVVHDVGLPSDCDPVAGRLRL